MNHHYFKPQSALSRPSWFLFLAHTALLLSLFWSIELAETYFHWAANYEQFELDELLALPVALTISLGVFFLQRSQLLHREVKRRTILEAQLHYQANHDVLTGLPNRKFFLERLAEALQATNCGARRTHAAGLADVNQQQARQAPQALPQGGNNRDVVVLFMDLDGFKVVNDSLGHEAGDQMIVAVAARLRRCLHNQAFVARLGGDEFTILIETVSGLSHVMQLVHAIQDELKEPIVVGSCEVTVTTSIGIAFAGDTNGTASEVLRNADAAMYAAKRQGKSRYEFFDKEMNLQAKSQLSLEAELRRAVRQEQFRVYYQPIFHLLTNQVVGVEALVRWDHPQRGILTPEYFLNAAESSGVINDIGDFVFFEACRQVGYWQRRFYQQALYLSINLSPRQLQHPAFVKQAMAIIHQTAFPAEQLHFEIIENTAMQNADLATSIMRQLQMMGVSVALDDFGTGYSSLAYLRRFPLNGLKIDRSFVMELERHAENLTIVRAVLALTQSMGLAVTAEGIESAAQLATLCAMGCEYGQGYYLARPMAAKEMDHFLTQRTTPALHGCLPADRLSLKPM
ncbi:MAG TPA: EAL domain-containing protein [Caldilineaceae bacterium]|nr:EAL domain-containing protein [Caldilineaceae bacterium]